MIIFIFQKAGRINQPFYSQRCTLEPVIVFEGLIHVQTPNAVEYRYNVSFYYIDKSVLVSGT